MTYHVFWAWKQWKSLTGFRIVFCGNCFLQYHVPMLRTMVLQKTEFSYFLRFLLNQNFTCLTAIILFLVMIKIWSQPISLHSCYFEDRMFQIVNRGDQIPVLHFCSLSMEDLNKRIYCITRFQKTVMLQRQWMIQFFLTIYSRYGGQL